MSDSVDRRRRLLLGAALSGVASRAFAQADAPARPVRAPPSERMEPLKHVDAGVLNIAYYEEGPADGPAAILLHGFPYDIHAYVDVAPLNLDITPHNQNELIDVGMRIKRAVMAAYTIKHPDGDPDLNFLYGTILVKMLNPLSDLDIASSPPRHVWFRGRQF